MFMQRKYRILTAFYVKATWANDDCLKLLENIKEKIYENILYVTSSTTNP